MTQPREQVATPPPDGATLVQTTESLAVSHEISLPKHVKQDASAPKVPGYVLRELMGEGAYGQVWRAFQIRTRKEVAVKTFVQRGGLDWIFLQREVERLTRLDRHPHIVTLLDTDLEAEPPFYVMDLIEAGSLQQFVKTGAGPPTEQVLRWMFQICDALAYVHGKGLIHCDLKPANILVDEQSNVRVVDFGQSRVFTESSATLGTLYYMAPEQASLAKPGNPVQPDVRWDIYSLGATVYAMLTGHPPHASERHNETLSRTENLDERLQQYREIIGGEAVPTITTSGGRAISRDLAAILYKCLAPDQENRYETIEKVVSDLEAMRAIRPVSPLAHSRAYRIKKFLQRNPFRVALSAATVVLIGVLIVASGQRRKLTMEHAHNILESLVSDPAEALVEIRKADGALARYMREVCGRDVKSPAYTSRVLAARGGLLLEPEAFWKSVDGGRLWENGEWLEVLEMPWDDPAPILPSIEATASRGTDRQKFVAFCLIGGLVKAGRIPPEQRPRLADACASAVPPTASPGVAAAAWWAAKCLGRDVSFSSGDTIIVDEVSGLAFVRIPPSDSFRRGSPASEAGRFPDEDPSEQGVSLKSAYLSMTEVPVSAIAAFLNSVASNEVMRADEREKHRRELKAMALSEQSQIAVGKMCLSAARAFCGWLNERAEKASPRRTFRLPTEDEWEYACRAGNAARFCFGDDARYAQYVAHCDGSMAEFHSIAKRMPNWYGLFDMHGGLWEFCDSKYDGPISDELRAMNRDWYVQRGGGFYSSAVRCRSAQRNLVGDGPDDIVEQAGIRLVMELEQK